MVHSVRVLGPAGPGRGHGGKEKGGVSGLGRQGGAVPYG